MDVVFIYYFFAITSNPQFHPFSNVIQVILSISSGISLIKVWYAVLLKSGYLCECFFANVLSSYLFTVCT